MSKKFFSLFLILCVTMFLLLFVVGCSGGTSVNNEIGGFIGGSTGLRMGIIDDAPPSTVFDGGVNPFSVVMVLENAGEASVGPGTDNPLVLARITGIEYTNFGYTPEQAVRSLNEKLESVKRNYDGSFIPGETTYVSFDNLVYSPDIASDLSLRIRAEVCYDYESYATTTFCMKSNLFNSWDDDSICSVRESKPVGNSGSPIQVTRVEEIPVSNNTVQMSFYIEHVGNGAFFQRSSYSSLSDVCLFNDANPDINKLEIFIEPVQGSSYSLRCPRLGGGASGVVTLVQGAPLTITCSLSRTNPTSVQSYKDIINIRMRYRYGEYVELPLTVQAQMFPEEEI